MFIKRLALAQRVVDGEPTAEPVHDANPACEGGAMNCADLLVASAPRNQL
jgi:hypothetical protein